MCASETSGRFFRLFCSASQRPLSLIKDNHTIMGYGIVLSVMRFSEPMNTLNKCLY